MPEAFSATISLSEERRPRPMKTPTSTAMGIVKIRTGGSVHRNSSAMVLHAARVADDQVHEADELRNEENEGEDGEPQSAWEATSRPMYRSRRRIQREVDFSTVERRHLLARLAKRAQLEMAAGAWEGGGR